MQHEPPTTESDTHGASQGKAISDMPPEQSQPAGGQPERHQSGMPNLADQAANWNQNNVAGYGQSPESLTDQTSEMPDLGLLQLAGKKEGSLSDYTIQQLQLRTQPFIGASAEGELFADEVTFSQISEIKQAIIKGDTVLLLTGEDGAGKTTLLKQLTRNSGARLQFFSVKGGEKYTTHNLFSGILDAWKLTPPAEFEDSAKEMLMALQANHERNTTVVLLLDDADLIPAKELHLLLATVQYFNNDELLLRVILSAAPEFESKLPQMLPRGLKLPYSVMQVEPFLASRAAPYIQLRLNQAGHFDEFPLSEKQVSAIANDASGYPGRINFLAAETLNRIFSPYASSEASTSSSGGFFAKPTSGQYRKSGKAILALLAIGLISAGVYKTVIQGQNNADTIAANNSSINQKSNNDFTTVETRPVANNGSGQNSRASAGSQASANNPSTSANNLSVPLQQIASGPGAASKTQNSVDNQQAAADDTNNTASSEIANAQTATTDSQADELRAAADELSAALGTTTTSSTTTETAPEVTDSEDSETKTEAAESTLLESAEKDILASQDSDVEAPQDAQVSEDTLVSEDAQVPEDAQAPVDETASAEAAATSTTDSAKVEEPTTATAEQPSAAEVTETQPDTTAPEAKPEVAEKTADGTISSLESPNWVLLQDPEQWTIQMSASTDKSDIDRFLRNAELKGPTSIYSFKRGEVTWYALVQGLYTGLGDARTAIEGMNEAAVKNQPWIRKIGSIQNALK